MSKRPKVTVMGDLWLSGSSKEVLINKIENEMTEHRRHQVTKLDINGCGLSELPECISMLINLKVLWANDNNIKVLSADVLCDLPLKFLDLEDNQIETFPHVKLPYLKRLFLRNNRLKALPRTIRECPLEYMYLSVNNFPAGCNINATSEYAVSHLLDGLEVAGCLVPLNWKPHSKTHMFVSDETHIEIKITMLVMKRVHIIKDLAYIISSYVAC